MGIAIALFVVDEEEEAGSASVELGVSSPGVVIVAFAGIDLGETAGEEVVEVVVVISGWDVMKDFTWAESVRYLAMFKWQRSSGVIAFSASSLVEISPSIATGDLNVLTA